MVGKGYIYIYIYNIYVFRVGGGGEVKSFFSSKCVLGLMATLDSRLNSWISA
jgi:hypothetical protein